MNMIASVLAVITYHFLRVATASPTSIPQLDVSNHDIKASQTTDSDCITRSSALQNLTITSVSIFKGSPFERENSSVSFQLFNTAIQIDAQCSAYDIALTPNAIGADPYKWYDCFMESRDARMSARFRYDATLNHLTVDERWVCDVEGGKSVQFTASNFEWLDVQCVDKGGSHVECIQPEGTEIYFPIEISETEV
ncbi:hypothetical protein V8F06_001656 [Rhypophila decipiens]